MKRMLSFLLCLIMVLSIAAPATAQASDVGNVYITDGNINDVVVGDNIVWDNIVVDGQNMGTPPAPTDLMSNSTVTAPMELPAEIEAPASCDCDSCGSIADHAADCVVKARYHKTCAESAESLMTVWADYSAEEQSYMLRYMQENLSGRYADFMKLLGAPAGSATETYVDGTTVSVEGIPEDGTLTVQEASDEVKEIVSEVVAKQESDATELFTYDVSVQDSEGADWQPDGSVKMELEMPGAKLHKHSKVYVVHVDDNGVASTIEAEVTEDGKIAFETPGFSTFAGFTVDFAYEGEAFSIKGLTDILVSEVMDTLKMPLFIEDVADVSFTDETLVSVTPVEDDWLLTSLQAFQTTEALTLTMNDGSVYEITVTDAITTKADFYAAYYGGGAYRYIDGYSVGGNAVVQLFLDSDGYPRSNDSAVNDIGDFNTQPLVIDGRGVGGVMEIVLQKETGAGNNLVWDLVELKITGGAKVIIRLGASFTGTETITINSVRPYTNAARPLFNIEDGSLFFNLGSDEASLCTGTGADILSTSSVAKIVFDGNDLSNGVTAPLIYHRQGKDEDNRQNLVVRGVTFQDAPHRAVLVQTNNMTNLYFRDCTFTSTVREIQYGGGAIYVDGGTDTSYNGSVNVVDVANFTLKNCTFSGNSGAGGHGGAIACFGDIYKLDVDGCTFTNCTSANRAGAIEMSVNDKTKDNNVYNWVRFKDTTFTNCTASSHGGAIDISNGDSQLHLASDIIIVGCTFTNCRATNNRGGAIRMVVGPTGRGLSIDSTSFSGCTSNSPGGAISVQGILGNVSITNGSSFSDCSSGARGGAIAIKCATVGNVTLSGSSFTNNTAGTLGGAIHVGIAGSAEAGPVVGDVGVSNCTFSGNRSNGVGGCLSLTDGTFNSVTIQNTSFANSYAANYGGAIGLKVYADDSASKFPVKVNNAVQILDCTFNNCTAGGLSPEPYDHDGDPATENKTTWDHDGNPATEEIIRLNGTGGGGAIAIGAEVVGGITIKSTNATNSTPADSYASQFINCSTWNNGGAICFTGVVKTTRIDLQYLLLDGCRARDAGNAIHLSNLIADDLKMDTCTIRNCSYFTQDFDIDIPGTEYDTLGKATYYAYDADGTFRCIGNTTCRAWIYNCTFRDNTSYSNGGGVYWNANNIRTGASGNTIVPSLKIEFSVFDGNHADRDGGGLYVEATVQAFGSHFYNNTVNGRGGAIAQQVYNNEARTLGAGEATNLQLNSSTIIYNNTAQQHGGGISITVSKTVSIADGTNLLYPVQFSLGGASVYNNKAMLNGGGIYYSTATYEDPLAQREVDNFQKQILINDGKIYGNVAGYYDTTDANAASKGGNGGGVYMSSNQYNTGDGTGYSKVSITSGTIYKNTAYSGNGGGVYLTGKNALCSVTGGTIGFYVENGAHVIEPNVAIPVAKVDATTKATSYVEGNGGGIAIYDGARIEMTGGNICYNEAYVGGGIAVRNGASMLSDLATDGTAALIDRNTATSAGGGIAVHDHSTMTINGGTVSNNTSAYGGGISVMTSGDKSTIGSTEENWGMIFNGGSVIDNLSSTIGGGICLSDNSTMQFNDGLVDNNKAATKGKDANGKDTYTYTSGHDGGGVAVCQGSQMDIYGGAISNNEAYSGGGLVVRGSSILNMYPVGKSDEEHADGLIQYNEGHGYGGGLSINAGCEVTIYGGDILNNEALAGGGIWTQGNHKETPGEYTTKISIYGGSISNNKATGTGMYNGQGGGIHADRCVDVLIADNDTTDDVGIISDNEAAKGGGVYVCNGAILTVRNGYIVYNKAVGSKSISTAYLWNHGLCGVGGGVYVADGYSADGITNPAVFTLEGTDIAIYGNTATNAADDVFANGVHTKLNLPLVGSMNLSGYPLPAVGWVEDYSTNDSNYQDGLNHGAEKGIANNTNVYRYRAASAYYRILVPEKTVSGSTIALADFSPNQNNVYAALTLGVPSAMPDAVVIDYGLPVKIDVKSNDIGLNGNITTLDRIGAIRPLATGGNVDMTEGSVDNQWSTDTGCSYGVPTVDGQLVIYTPNSLTMDGKDEFSYALRYSQPSGDAYYFYSAVTVIPATSIYYEDNFTDADGNSAIDYTVYSITTDDKGNVTETLNKTANEQWMPEGGAVSQQYQEEDRPGIQGGVDHDNVYGYDGAYDKEWSYYSLNQSMKVSVNSTKSAKAKFTFKGRGFDILAVTNNISGTILVTVDRLDAEAANKYYMVDTYYGYTYDSKKNEWIVDTEFDSNAHLYQIPVMKVEGLDYGEYAVEICLAYDKMFDHRNLGYYSFYLDAIRIYDPADDGVISTETTSGMKEDTTIRDAYIADGEYLPTYYEIRDLLLEADKLSNTSVAGSVFVDGIDSVDSASIIKYQHYGPNNEVYLARGQAIAFNLNFSGNVASVHMGMKRLLGASDLKIYTIEGEVKTEVFAKTLLSASELYFDLSDYNGSTIVVENATSDTTSAHVVALTNLKVTDSGAGLASGEMPFSMDKATAAKVLSMYNVEEPVIALKYPTLSFESEVNYNVYFAVEGADVSVDDMGLITFDSAVTDGTIENASEIIPGAVIDGEFYVVNSKGIAAKNLADKLYFKVYAKLSDGSYIYSKLAGYSAADYANSVLSNAGSSVEMKALVVAMLNYGTAAQNFFGYHTDSLLSDAVADELKIGISDYSGDMLDVNAAVSADVASAFANNGGFTYRYPNVSFDGAFEINYHFMPAYAVDGEMMMYYWDAETYNAVDALTIENATGTMMTTLCDNGEYVASCSGIAAKNISDTIYVAAVYENDGTVFSSGVLAYSIGAYCASSISSGTVAMQAFAKATAVYGWYAKSYFGNV